MIGARHIREVGAEIEEWVRLKEELVKDLVAVLLVLVSTTEDTVGAFDTEAETLVTVLFVNCSQLHARKHFVRLADHVELRQVEAHLSWVLERVVLQGVFLEAK